MNVVATITTSREYPSQFHVGISADWRGIRGVINGRAFEYNWSINRTELIAILESIRWYTMNKREFESHGFFSESEPCNFQVYTSSKYVFDHIGEDLRRWVTNRWVKHNGKPVINRDLWAVIFDELGLIGSFNVWYNGCLSLSLFDISHISEGAIHGSACTGDQTVCGSYSHDIEWGGSAIESSVFREFTRPQAFYEAPPEYPTYGTPYGLSQGIYTATSNSIRL